MPPPILREGALTLWFTAGHHFGHANIIDLCRRPFRDSDEMDGFMVERWNATVGSNDEVWHLGNFAYRCGPNRKATIFGSLNGREIHLVRGNHDGKTTLSLPWSTIQHYAEIRLGSKCLILFHYALGIWSECYQGSISLHGHSYGNLRDTPTSCDVGVDAWNFKPVSLGEIVSRLCSARNSGHC